MATTPVELLRKACTTSLSSNASLSEDGQTLTLFGASYDAAAPHTMTLNDGKGGTKDVSYTLASIYLQLVNPSVLQYRKACESAKVEDPVKILDKGLISLFFFDDDAADDVSLDKKTDGGDDAMNMSDDDDDDDNNKRDAVNFSSKSDNNSKRSSHKEKDRRSTSSSGRDKDRRSSSDKRSRSQSKSRKGGDKNEDDDDHDRKKSKVPKAPITNEQLVANLGKIVDKRDTASNMETPSKDKEEMDAPTDSTPVAAAVNGDGADSSQVTPAATPTPTDDEGLTKEETEEKEKEDRELILKWLSPEGFQVDSPTVAAAIEADREAVRRITALEIPVGDSASILRAGAGGEIVDKVNDASASLGGGVKKRDFKRVLDLYQEVVMAEERAKRSSSSSGGKKRPPPPPSGPHGSSSKNPRTSSGGATASGGTSTKPSEGNPIIVVPNAMTSAITMINAGLFLGKDATFVPRDQAVSNPKAGKRGGTISITRKLHPRLGGAEITYDIIDNPTTRLKKDEWNRVVAVVCQGAAWQFKGWRYSDPVDLFSRTFGFYVGLEGSTAPNELRGWNVKIGKVSRDRRGLDNISHASFWNGLDEFMAVKNLLSSSSV